jgi:hypothetical protein
MCLWMTFKHHCYLTPIAGAIGSCSVLLPVFKKNDTTIVMMLLQRNSVMPRRGISVKTVLLLQCRGEAGDISNNCVVVTVAQRHGKAGDIIH